ncbi:PREDICTED: uncharacterized protein LOC109466568 [Branchiostoma belcheri]|uniref:Uncharacterized protein LOC109466568 n=1 Tax=Branchiostoma belcheri TaxID=7741 RepID=A0A6P4Y5Y2_BRABE|nr:PREDICTED: uncharacterized protein LOC109466568 [Branchiostoma belcheri]
MQHSGCSDGGLQANSYYWNTPSGRRHLNSYTDIITIKNFTEKDSGVYTYVADKAADTAFTTQVEVHQYSNDDTPGHSADTEEGQDQGQSASHIDETESDEEERPYGMAAANSAYEDTDLHQNETVPGNHNTAPHYCAANSDQVGTTPSVSRNSLYGQQCENITVARNSTSIADDLGILYGSCPATDE